MPAESGQSAAAARPPRFRFADPIALAEAVSLASFALQASVNASVSADGETVRFAVQYQSGKTALLEAPGEVAALAAQICVAIHGRIGQRPSASDRN